MWFRGWESVHTYDVERDCSHGHQQYDTDDEQGVAELSMITCFDLILAHMIIEEVPW